MKISTVDIKESMDGDLYFNLPDEVIDRLGWEEGDELIWDHNPVTGQAMIRKVRYEVVSLDLDEDTFTGVAKMAHQNDVTFNKQIEAILQEFIDKCETDPEYIKKINKVADAEQSS